ncbi:SDR family oxidoreductase [Brevibacterium sp. 91QC2O2]|jgi:3-oxoacyl-[acyl-carrier protein] reductase|uniref:SDR family NAD(P)-dependent oxidoreductase n=1 Tax=Brevibacterium TaxID=1696 RepID=UPI00211BE6A4|nr:MULTISPECIES: SDR family oxidoreductase [unclassified Brevibacterium]MCQ9368855.1 SDR family oxidoreductase [Brevibacterium sp. 91QC2O2]MCQ9386646.1 SDR family oxidoreductase [Brevibacterium sp. 68QC2CO]
MTDMNPAMSAAAGFRPKVIVTGAASGIGKEIAREFAEQGADLVLIDFDADRLAEAAAGLPNTAADAPGTVETIDADLRDASAIPQMMERVFARGAAHVLVNAAGVYPAAPLLELTADLWDAVQAINVRAPLLLTVAFARQVLAAGIEAPAGYPCVVNISSGAALRARPGAAHYTTSKAALEMVTRASALELGPQGIRVNAVAPGFVVVDSTLNLSSADYISKVSETPLGRKGRPDDIARAVLWMASPAAEWVTGEVLRVDGGSSTGAMNLPVHWAKPRTEVSDAHDGAAAKQQEGKAE